MKELQSRQQFVIEQVSFFGIDDTQKNFKKIYTKAKRILESWDYWQDAPTKVIERNRTKLFTQEQLQKLKFNMETYLLKQSSKYDYKHYLKLTSQITEQVGAMEDDMENEHHPLNLSPQAFDKMMMQASSDDPYYISQVSREEKLEVMMTALFERFFTPLDLNLWNKDISLVEGARLADDPLQVISSLEYQLAKERLDAPNKCHYYSRKRDIS
ncbi:hypothetical protein ABVB01_01160 [Streptococcus dysgalactiae subsp. equisimilis]